jgi:hypothetical protein
VDKETGWKPILPIRPLSLAQGQDIAFRRVERCPKFGLFC